MLELTPFFWRTVAPNALCRVRHNLVIAFSNLFIEIIAKINQQNATI